jgi:hypothetical protein
MMSRQKSTQLTGKDENKDGGLHDGSDHTIFKGKTNSFECGTGSCFLINMQ